MLNAITNKRKEACAEIKRGAVKVNNSITETDLHMSLDKLADHVQKNFERIACEKNPRISRRTGIPTYEVKCNEYHCGFRVSENGRVDTFARDNNIERILCLVCNYVDDLQKEHDEEIDGIRKLYFALSIFLDVMDGLFYKAADTLVNMKDIEVYT